MNQIRVDDAYFTPSKVVCIGRNYVAHIEELNNEVPEQPVIFIKPNSAISSTMQAGVEEPIHYEGELCFVVRNGGLAAVGFGLDLTKRALQSRLKEKGLPWERAKCFDGAALFSPFVTFEGELSALSMKLLINGECVQEADYALMMNKPEAIFQAVSEFMSLESDDVLMTGTPKGVGVVNAGDIFVGQVFAGEQLLIEHSWTVKP